MTARIVADPPAEMIYSAARRRSGGSVGSTRRYLRPAREQLYLLAPCPSDWVPEGHLAHFVIDVVAELDTSALHTGFGVCPGRLPYEPEMMVELLLYSYCLGIRSARVIEALCRTDAAFRMICGAMTPDHSTIARFVVSHERALEGLFTEGVRLCAAAGLVRVSVLALDGTKIAADASLDRNRDAGWIRAQIAELLAVTGADDGDGTAADIDPAARRGLSARKVRLEAALAVVEAEDRAAQAEAEKERTAAAAAAEQGRLRLGRKPSDPRAALARAQVDERVCAERVDQMRLARAAKDAAPAEQKPGVTAPPRCRIARAEQHLERARANLRSAERAVAELPAQQASKANVTDPDSRIMKTRDGWVQGYNAQAICDENHVVLACDVSQDASDVNLYVPTVQKLLATLAAAGVAVTVGLAAAMLILADAGYWSLQNATSEGPDRLIATLKDHKQRQAAQKLGHTEGPPDPNASQTEQMEHLLRTPQGAAAYAKRSTLIEPVFADRKHNRNIRQFRRRGLPAVKSEWAFINLAGNVLKLYRHQQAQLAAT